MLRGGICFRNLEEGFTGSLLFLALFVLFIRWQGWQKRWFINQIRGNKWQYIFFFAMHDDLHFLFTYNDRNKMTKSGLLYHIKLNE